MAIYHCRIKVHSRGRGAQASKAAAYRSGTRITTSRRTNAVRAAAYRAGTLLAGPDGEVHDFTRKQGVVWNAILAPDGAAEWVFDRAELWRRVEAVEVRKDAQLFREFELTIPRELTPDQRIALVTTFAKEHLVARGMVVDIGLHCPVASDGGEQPHAHLSTPFRRLDPTTKTGFGLKERDWNGARYARKDAKRTEAIPVDLLTSIRKDWATACNQALADAGSSETVDHRSLRDQKLSHEPMPHQGQAVHVREPKDGYARKRGDLVRALFQRRAREAAQAIGRPRNTQPLERSFPAGDSYDERVAHARQAITGGKRPYRRHARDGVEWSAELARQLHGRAQQLPVTPDPEREERNGYER